MVTFIHTADVHYGMENYGKVDPVTGIHSRLIDFDKAFNYCIDSALKQQVDFFLFSGDAYKTTNPSPTQQRLFLKALLRLHAANIPVIIVIGNHDNPLSFGKATTLDIFGDLPLEGFHVITKPTALTIKTKKTPVQIVGIPWPTRNTISLAEHHTFKSTTQLTEYIAQRVTEIIRHLAQSLDPQLPAILAGHLTVASGIFSGSEKRAIYGTDPIFLPSQLAIAPFDYVALGHLHRHQNLNPHGYPPLVYSGSVERIDFGERKEEKGFCLVTIHKKGKTDYQFITTPQRPFIQIEVTLVNNDIPQTTQIIKAIEQQDIEHAIVKIIYYIPENTADLVDLAAIQRACSNAHDVTGIIPVHHAKKRSLRSRMKIDMDLETLLKSYFATKPELQEQQTHLIRKALELQQQISNDDL